MHRTWLSVVRQLKRDAKNPLLSYNTLSTFAPDLQAATIVQPEKVRHHFPELAAAADRVVASAATRLTGCRISHAFLGVMDACNALECAGCSIAETSHGVFRDWLARMELSRDDPHMDNVWSTGFAALALDEQPTYRRIAAGVARMPFTAGETFGFNVQGLLGHVAAAVENRERLTAVTPAWEELLRNYHLLRDASSVRAGTLLWIARVVHHRIAGAPVGEGRPAPSGRRAARGRAPVIDLHIHSPPGRSQKTVAERPN